MLWPAKSSSSVLSWEKAEPKGKHRNLHSSPAARKMGRAGVGRVVRWGCGASGQAGAESGHMHYWVCPACGTWLASTFRLERKKVKAVPDQAISARDAPPPPRPHKSPITAAACWRTYVAHVADARLQRADGGVAHRLQLLELPLQVRHHAWGGRGAGTRSASGVRVPLGWWKGSLCGLDAGSCLRFSHTGARNRAAQLALARVSTAAAPGAGPCQHGQTLGKLRLSPLPPITPTPTNPKLFALCAPSRKTNLLTRKPHSPCWMSGKTWDRVAMMRA